MGRINAPLLITMFTDASHCSQTKLAAYAVWAKVNGETIRRSGLFRDKLPDSMIAEAMALVNGIHIVVATLAPPPQSRIIAQTDCLAVIGLLTNPIRRGRTKQKYAAILDRYRSAVSTAQIEVEFRHVASHKGDSTPRNAVNTWCDRECRALMRQARRTPDWK